MWAPLVRWLRRPWMLATVLVAALVASPLLRHAHYAWMTPTHTLIHLDGIAWGSLLAHRAAYLAAEPAGVAVDGAGRAGAGISAAGTIAGGTRFLDSALAVGFAGGGAGPDRINRRAQPGERGAEQRARWLFMGASAMGST